MPIAITNLLQSLRGPDSAARGLGAPLLLLIVLAMIVVPLAPFVLDLLFDVAEALGAFLIKEADEVGPTFEEVACVHAAISRFTVC
jgi:hypothetical protein